MTRIHHVDHWDPASDAAQQFCKIAHAALDMLSSTRDATTAAVATLSLAVVFREINSGIGNALYMDESIRMSGVFTPRRLEQRRFRCRWRDLDTSARTTAGACRQASACASAAASGRRVWSTASADA